MRVVMIETNVENAFRAVDFHAVPDWKFDFGPVTVDNGAADNRHASEYLV